MRHNITMRFGTAAIAALWQLATVQCVAQQPPHELTDVPTVKELATKPSASLKIGTLEIKFEETTLQSIGLELHNVLIQHSQPKGDEHSGHSWLCFTVIGDSHRERLWLMSDDEFGGGRDNAVTGIYAVQLVGSAAPTEKCPESPRQFGSLNFDNHLWLGASVRDVEAAFGSALPASDGWWRYSCVGKETDARQGKPVEFDVFSRFDIKLQHGIVTAIRASQISST
jgi:hypothetical protein